MNVYPRVQLVNPNSTFGQWANKLFDRFIAPIVRLRTFQMAYAKAVRIEDNTDLWTKVLHELKTTITISPTDLARIPKTGPLIIVANHPHGIMDGVLLGSLMHRVRDDYKIIMNEATTMPGLEENLLFVSIFGTQRENAKKNIQVMRKALDWLNEGHVIVVFPAGEISSISQWHEKIALDNTWSTGIIRLSLSAKAPILPLFIVGQNDNVFLKLGLIHPVFRTLQIGRVTNHLCGEEMSVRASHPIPSVLLQTFKEDATRVDYIRGQLYALHSRESTQLRCFAITLDDVNKTNIDGQQMNEAFDVLNAQEAFKVRENNTYSVLLFNQQQLLALGQQHAKTFAVLKDEIGRLRELTFREVGEGSGKLRDLDQYDEYYSHLTLWDRQHKRLIGAYRLAFTDNIFSQYGIEGLYTASQFDYNPELFAALGPAIEMSRAFIIKDHQKTPLALSMLLGALGQVLIENDINSFFGVVSISNEFQSISKKLIVDFLMRHHSLPEFKSWVTPKNPPQLSIEMADKEWQRLLNTVCDLSLLNAAVASIELDGKNIPPLFSIYTSLKGRFVAFDHDTGFNSIDGLIVLSMQSAVKHNPLMVKRLLGKKIFDAYNQI